MIVTITYAIETNDLNSLVLNDIETITRHGEVIIFIDVFGETYTFHYSNIIFSVR